MPTVDPAFTLTTTRKACAAALAHLGANVTTDTTRCFHLLVLAAAREVCHQVGDPSAAHTLADVLHYTRNGDAGDEYTHLIEQLLAPAQYTVHIPYVPGVPTSWHPRESTGPFSVLSRGTFDTPSEADKWATAHLGGNPYTIKRIL